jgi:myo-inositol-1-phosphate synthase
MTQNAMATSRYGIWLIGARGGVSTTTLLGLLALQQQATPETGLVTALPDYADLPLAQWDQLVVGGHEIRDGSLLEEATALHQQSRVFTHQLLAECQEQLATIDQNIVPGTLWNVGQTIRDLATLKIPEERTPREVIDRLQADLTHFRDQHQLSEVVVVNLASTEPPVADAATPASWQETVALLEQPDSPLAASSLYAIAALQLGMPYVNFTPSAGATAAGIDELARARGTCHAGRDGKTGETLLKSVLAPMFAARNLEVMSWVGHNIFGNLDGKVLDDPANKAAKVQSKDHLLQKMLGYAPQTLVSIEHIQSLHDWKTAWDHIHFQGFLQTPMTLQLTWQGCDSLLAAPLVLDLVRFTLLAKSRGETGALAFLSSFFKSPIGTENQAFSDQLQMLDQWLKQAP